MLDGASASVFAVKTKSGIGDSSLGRGPIMGGCSHIRLYWKVSYSYEAISRWREGDKFAPSTAKQEFGGRRNLPALILGFKTVYGVYPMPFFIAIQKHYNRFGSGKKRCKIEY
jgi:hypothetical protein